MTQGQADGLDFLGGALTQMGDRAVFDLASLTIGCAQEKAGVDYTILPDRGDVGVYSDHYY
jgi:hypothetical protein